MVYRKITQEEFDSVMKLHVDSYWVKGRTDIYNAAFHYVDFTGLLFKKDTYRRCIFKKCLMRRLELKNKDFAYTSFYGSDLTNSSFADSALYSSDLRHTKLEGTDLTSALLFRAAFDYSTVHLAKLPPAIKQYIDNN